MKTRLLTTLAVAAFSVAAQAAPAAKTDGFKAGDFMMRGRALAVVPQENSHLSIGGDAQLDNSVVPELDFTYFFTPNIAAELIAGVTPHNVRTSGGVDAGSVWLLPPTVTVQYHFTQFNGFKPYLGAGVNYTHFFNEDAGALTSVDYEDNFGVALQAGVDVPVSDNWYINADVKKIYLSTTAKFAGGIRADVDIDPWLMGVGVGYKF